MIQIIICPITHVFILHRHRVVFHQINEIMNTFSNDDIRDIIHGQEELPPPDQIDNLTGKAKEKLKGIKIFSDLIDDFLTLIRLVRAYTFRGYREVPLKSILAAVAAIIYFVNPVDLIPDFIPIIGYIDDAAVVGLALRFIHEDLENFRKWEQDQEAKQ